jgi:hypothetical protein
MKTFIRHYIEMVVAMLLGMFVLGWALRAGGTTMMDWYDEATELAVLGMAVAMTVPMVAWMRYRGHGWTPAWEMSGSMFVPALAGLAFFWAGAIQDGGALMMLEHVAMFPAMLAVMLFRRAEYSGHVHA